MNVGQVRPQDATKPVLIQRPARENPRPSVASGVDQALLSESAREAVREADRQAARLRAPDHERQQIVEAARRKLEQGELDDPAVLRETAKRMLGDATAAP